MHEETDAPALVTMDLWFNDFTAMEFAITAGQTRLITPTNIQDRFCRRAPLKDFLAISVAAILGANLRYILSRLAVREFGPIFPYGTLIINILGSFIVGLFVIWTTERVLMDPRWRLLVVIGFCGSFTTFSSYAFETDVIF